MVDRSVVFNNAGVMLMDRGHFQVALDLFRGALESKMKCAAALSRTDDVSASAQEQEDASPPTSCIAKAERLMSNISVYLNERSTVTIVPITSTRECLRSANDDKIVIPTACREPNPYLYRTPFLLPEVADSPSPVEEDSTDMVCFTTQLSCCMIIFNLAILHHMMDMSPYPTMHFYDLANALLLNCGDIEADNEEEADVLEAQMLLLRLAIYNNYSVCGYENCDAECMVVYLECLDRLLNPRTEPDAPTMVKIDSIDPSVIQGIQSNIQSILKPEHGNSAAA